MTICRERGSVGIVRDSPFELLYGRDVRGPMVILRELCSVEVNDGHILSTYQYVIELRERLEQTCKLAWENLEKVHEKQKPYYDRRVSLTSETSTQREINCYFSRKVHMKSLSNQ